MKILKFGGSSLVSPQVYKKVLQICNKVLPQSPSVVVVSALGGVTNQLLELIDTVEDVEKRNQILFRLYSKHRSLISYFLPEEKVAHSLRFVTEVLNHLTYLLDKYGKGIIHTHSWHEIVGAGEILSAQLFADILSEQGTSVRVVQGYEVIQTHRAYPLSIDYETTNIKAKELKELVEQGIVPVVSGFIAQVPENKIITLGREGSDFSAAILGAVLNANEIQIWTDVAGIYTADPHLIPTAKTISELSYEEACQLSWLGANILHRRTIFPVLRKQIPIRILSTYHPNEPGTIIKTKHLKNGRSIQSISYISDLVQLKFSARSRHVFNEFIPFIYGVFAQGEIPLYDIHNHSLQQSIQLLTSRDALHDLTELIRKQFKETVHFRLSPSNDALIGIIGNDLQNNSLLLNEIFTLFNSHHLPVTSAACNAPSQTITIQTAESHLKKAVQLLHAHFFSNEVVVNLYVAGPTGNVGQTFIRELQQQSSYSPGRFRVKFKLAGLINRRNMLLEKVPTDKALGLLKKSKRSANWDRFLSHILENQHEPSCFVDLTGSDFVALQYACLLENGVGVITANKIAFSGDWPYYQRIHRASFLNSVPLKYETTVCSATPVIHTCRSLSVKHDAVVEIEGILSGTLTYLVDALHRGLSFSTAVRHAVETGIAEPHPAMDLSGQDVARKLLILIREAGFKYELNQIEIESLIPEGLDREDDARIFLQRLSIADEQWKKRVTQAEKKGHRLAYIAAFDGQCARVGIREIGADNDFARTTGIENIVRIRSRQFNDNPIIVRGPGAGRLITAQGVLSDIKEAVGQLIQSEKPSINNRVETIESGGESL